ncbi:MAG: DUF3825 domain-containing protein [Ruminococcaceae bacterium]|nr:DUF3825 domain-containing protein [Oscillospiraceae bacterium]
MTIQQKFELYDLLLENYEVGQREKMGLLGHYLGRHDIKAKTYRCGQLKEVFEQMSDFFTIDNEYPENAPPIPYVTILERPNEETLLAEEIASEEAIGEKFASLPERMDGELLHFDYNQQDRLAKYINGYECRLSEEQIEQVHEDYRVAKENETIVYDKEHECFTFPLSFETPNELPLMMSIKADECGERCPWKVHFVGIDYARAKKEDPGDKLRSFAWLGNQTEFLRSLAELAKEEVWRFNDNPDDYYILNQYITYTFYKLKLSGKVYEAEDGSFAAFNTGLQSRKLGEDIFAYFERNAEGASSPYKFRCFCSSDSNDNRFYYKHMFDEFGEPKPAEYFTEITDLLFDPKSEVQPMYQHVFEDNCGRLPFDLLEEKTFRFPQARALVEQIKTASGAEKKVLFKQLGKEIWNTEDPKLSMQDTLDGAIKRTLKRVRRNYKLAVPCFYPKRNKMSMMLPLSFTASGEPELVLVCERTNSGNYLGQTILTLAMAYVDARLICQPGSEWLNTSLITTSEQPDTFDEN